MKSQLSLIVFFVFLLGNLFSQDQLFKKDNTKLEVKILEINPTEIKYKLKSNPDGPLYVVLKNEVALVIYANGEHETFSDAKSEVPKASISQQVQVISYDSLYARRKREALNKFNSRIKHKNAIFINALALGNNCLSFSMFREFANGRFSVHLPFSFSIAEPTIPNNGLYNNFDYYYDNISEQKVTHKALDIGLGIYFHTSGKNVVTHFIGPLIRMAQYNGTFRASDYYYDPVYGMQNYSGPYKIRGFVMNETYLMINNGVLFRITPRFNLMIHAAMGVMANRDYIANDPKNFSTGTYTYDYNKNPLSNPVFNLGFHAGFRF